MASLCIRQVPSAAQTAQRHLAQRALLKMVHHQLAPVGEVRRARQAVLGQARHAQGETAAAAAAVVTRVNVRGMVPITHMKRQSQVTLAPLP